MHIAICLHGIHFIDNDNVRVKTNFEEVLKNNEKFLFNNLRENGHTIDFFLNTYDSPKLPQLVEYFKPVATVIRNFNNYFHGIIQILNQKINFEMLNEYINKTRISYDLIITIRFDLIFFKYFSDMNYIKDKINIVYKHVTNNGKYGLNNCEDNFFIIPQEHIYTMLLALCQMNDTLHEINHYLPEDTIHYMYTIVMDDVSQITDNKYYSIHRIKNLIVQILH